MTRVELKLHGYRYLPYEQRLAELEVERLLGAEPVHVNGSPHIETLRHVDSDALSRLTYFREATVAGSRAVIPQQAKLEASATSHRDPGQLRRQQTRYSAHGLHEYRGKFNPQMVRVVSNLLGLSVGDRIWDPFCGSGTVLLEARHQGLNAVGVDLNPLAVAIANAKLSAIEANPECLKLVAGKIANRVHVQASRLKEGAYDERNIEGILGLHWLERLPCPEYLARWFPLSVLAQLQIILDAIYEEAPPYLRDVFRIIASDIVRDVSWQDPNDLRVRRRKNPAPNYPAVKAFASALHARINAVIAAQEHIPPHRGWQSAFLGDSGEPSSIDGTARAFLEDGVSCIVSSPPYVTALPYIDTQRLSIAILGLASVQEIRDLGSSLVGSREILTRERLDLEESIEGNSANVADDVWKLCKVLKDAYDPSSDGFRRQNTPAVVYRYFAGMTRVMAEAKRYLDKGGWLALIVGPNQTSLGGVKFLIDTPALLAATGNHVGLELREIHHLNAYSRYDVHSRNSIREEQLLIMKRP